jgi:hypothetical protein
MVGMLERLHRVPRRIDRGRQRSNIMRSIKEVINQWKRGEIDDSACYHLICNAHHAEAIRKGAMPC